MKEVQVQALAESLLAEAKREEAPSPYVYSYKVKGERLDRPFVKVLQDGGKESSIIIIILLGDWVIIIIA